MGIDISQVATILPWVLTGLFLLVMVVSVLVALARGFFKSATRGFIVLGCLILALIITLVAKGSASTVYETVSDSLSGTAKEALEQFSNSTELQTAVTGAVAALVAPLIFLLVFFVLRWLSWLIFFIVFIILSAKAKKKNKPLGPNFVQKIKLPRLFACLIGAVQGLLIFFVFMTPIYSYLKIITPVATAALQQEEVQESVQSSGVDSEELAQFVKNANKNFFVESYGNLLGRPTCNALTSFKAQGKKTNLIKEMDAIGVLYGDILKIINAGGIENFGEEQGEAIKAVATHAADSKLVMTIVGEGIYMVTDKWLNDEKIFDMEKPDLGDIGNPVMTQLLLNFKQDAKNMDQLSKDFETLGNVVSILAKSDVFQSLGSGSSTDTEELIQTLAGGDLIKDLITEIGKNSTMKNLVPEFANIGMRAIGSALSLPENADEVYDDYIARITESVNRVLRSNTDHNGKVDQLAALVQEALDESGLEIELDIEIVKIYADAILTDIEDAGKTSVTEDDIREFFELYSKMSADAVEGSPARSADAVEDSTARLVSVTRAGTKANGLYGGKSLEELMATSGVGKLAQITQAIAAASEGAGDETAFQEQISQIKENFNIGSLNISKGTFTKSHLKTTSEIKEGSFPTVLVTMEELLIDTAAVNKQINEATIGAEAEKIGNIFSTAMRVMDSFKDTSSSFTLETLSTIATDLGSILDSLDSTTTFEGKTSRVITAIFQKPEVADNLGINVRTATELAKAATEGKGSYTSTMESVSRGAVIADKIGKGEQLTEEEIAQLIETMTPQTAKMLDIYLTEDRVESYGIPVASTELLKALFHEMEDKAKYPDYVDQTSAMLKIFEVAIAAKDTTSQNVFNRGETVGMLGVTAEEMVQTVMSSKMVCNAIMSVMYNANGVIREEMKDPFNLSFNTASEDYKDLENAIAAYAGEHPESKTALKAIAALFNVGTNVLD